MIMIILTYLSSPIKLIYTVKYLFNGILEVRLVGLVY